MSKVSLTKPTILIGLLLLVGCTGSDATVKMTCIDGPVEGCVDGDCTDIELNETQIWLLKWDGGLFTKSTKNYQLTVSDRGELGSTRIEPVELKDGDVIEWVLQTDSILNQAKVIIANDGSAMSGCVNDECHNIAAGGDRAYLVTWTGGFYANPPLTVKLYAEDLQYPTWTASNMILLENGDTYRWTVGKKGLGSE